MRAYKVITKEIFKKSVVKKQPVISRHVLIIKTKFEKKFQFNYSYIDVPYKEILERCF